MRWLLFCLLLAPTLAHAAPTDYARTEEVVYGRKHGMALTMEVFTPTTTANGYGVVMVVSGGWVSSREMVNPLYYLPVIARGYTVFAVQHGSQPRFTIPEAADDIRRAVRFVRQNAIKFKINPERIGIMGASAGCHLSLLLGTTGTDGDPMARDPMERVSSRVQAVAGFFPPTDFLNYGASGTVSLGTGVLQNFRAAFDFCELDPASKTYRLITNEEQRRAIGKAISPVYHVTAKSAPTILAHGDADKLVPLQQSELLIAKLKEQQVPCELLVKAGAGHGWLLFHAELEKFADWFDRHLRELAKP
jgi:acetyl esterase/lipase